METVPPNGWRGSDVALLVVSIALGVILLVVLAVTVSLAVVGARAAEARIGTEVSPDLLVEGDCVAEFAKAGSALAQYTIADCDQTHAAELVFIAEFGEEFGVYLGTSASAQLASSICETTMRYRLHLEDIPEEYSDAMLFGVYQSRANWAEGQTFFQCFLVNRDGTPLVGGFYKKDVLG
jgi:hypothetical protein